MSENNLKAHLFICTHHKNEGESCGAKNSIKLRTELKDALKNHKTDVRINTAGCLGKCSEGIAAVLYPQTKWYLGLKHTDLDFLKNEVLSNLKS
jgi:(2Fe-2S) ferredoxin